VLRIDQRIQIPRCEVGTDVSGPACIYPCVEVRKGTVVYLQGERERSASPCDLRRSLPFKRVYGMPPVRYRHQVRVMDALMRLAEGEAPVDVF
jgi:hypothetical protein